MIDTGLRGAGALVTGGASGLGQSIAVGLAAEGVRVLVADRRPGSETVAEITAAGGRASFVVADLRYEQEIEALVEAAATELGTVELLVNVAGVYAGQPVTDISLELWNELMATNATACALLSRRIGSQMIDRGGGSILIVGSTVVCAPSYAGGAYRASKMALRSYMETLAIELAPFSIRVNMLTPGPFPTRLNDELPADQRLASAREVPLGQREGRLEEVRSAALFLLSDSLASYVTGTEIYVDGGWHLRPAYLGAPEVVRLLNRPEHAS